MKIKVFEKLGVVLAIVVGTVLWAIGVDKFLKWFNCLDNPYLTYIFYSVICAPIFEEIMFRHGPLYAVKEFTDQNTAKGLNLTTLTVLVSSIIFGLMHGRGTDSILIQGFAGLGFAIVYLRNGYSYWSAVLAHALYNAAWMIIK